MTSLTQVSILSRKIIRYSIYTAIFIVIVRYSYLIGTKIYRKYFPEPPPPPTLSFGKLAKIPFPEKEVPKDLVFTLETVDGKLPKFPKQLSVYFMPKAISTINSLDSAKQKATSLGFDPNGVELVETVYLFKHSKSPASLNLNIVTGIFSISYDLNSKPSVLEQPPPDPKTATALAKTYLTRARSLPGDLTGPVANEYLKIQDGKIVPASSLSNANVTKINLYRKDYNDLSNVTGTANQANIWFMFTGSRDPGDQVIAAEYKYFSVDENKSGTYPIKTSDEAWEELKSGNAYFANVDDSSNGNITIRKVYPAYYDPNQYTEFYQPVIVFEGDNNFAAYVSAVANDYVQ
ncbi:MAG: hypothetical protein UT39_C0012G0021 [Candidatus Woesebacteria bacterium GW2011_GWA1_39_21]|uniref:Uncharacterized protein n=1 Tax=Candidatus Woesebacteria bacterium GW2011_GWA1_39_21 TaxID=1618550 RepID=A0A0G0N445_9BACT|nr:MAG: hypothetical protein UT39_C0012G0021 [Candidatus Woesebacteria bacterium GW2011_GWA1_39_21]